MKIDEIEVSIQINYSCELGDIKPHSIDYIAWDGNAIIARRTTMYYIQSFERLLYVIQSLKEEVMAKLTTKARKKIPSKKFAEPAERKYPIEDKAHAKNALARATQQEKKGKLSPSKANMIKAKANKVLGKGKKN